MFDKKLIFFFAMFGLFNLTFGLYIEKSSTNPQHMNEKGTKDFKHISDTEWNVFKTKLGLTDRKVDLLKSQKNQKTTAELIKQFIRENPKYITLPYKNNDLNSFPLVYFELLRQLKSNKNNFKAFLRLEVSDKLHKTLKRSPRRIAFKIMSDISSDKIDDLLKIFNEQHGLENAESNEVTDNYENELPTTSEPDYIYENLWEDEESSQLQDLHSRGLQLDTFQDLIAQANRQHWEREMEETKLNKHIS